MGCDLATTAWAAPAAETAPGAFSFTSSCSSSSQGDAPSWSAFATARPGPKNCYSHELLGVSLGGTRGDTTFPTPAAPISRRSVTFSEYLAEATGPGHSAFMAAAAGMGSESAAASRLSTDLLVRQVQGNGGWHAAVQDLHDERAGSSGYGSCYDTVVGCDQSVCSSNAFWDSNPIGNELLAGYDMY